MFVMSRMLTLLQIFLTSQTSLLLLAPVLFGVQTWKMIRNKPYHYQLIHQTDTYYIPQFGDILKEQFLRVYSAIEIKMPDMVQCKIGIFLITLFRLELTHTYNIKDD